MYVTNVYDLGRKRLLWSGEGRTQATLEAFFDFLGPDRTAALICCDMWQDVFKALVFDKFHNLMAAVDQVRRDEIREKGPAHKACASLHRGAAPAPGAALKINRAYLRKLLELSPRGVGHGT